MARRNGGGLAETERAGTAPFVMTGGTAAQSVTALGTGCAMTIQQVMPYYPGTMSDAPAPPSLAGLFFGFFTVGMCGFGGTLPWARRMVVEQRRWMSPAEFTDMLGLCQFLPGGNILNLTVALGARFHGVAGSAAAFLGLMAAPMTIVVMLGEVYARYGGLPAVHAAFDGLAAAATALVLATALRIAAPLRARPLGIAIAVATFAGIALLRWPLPLVLVVVAPLSVLIAWRSGP